jgi:4-hydroxybenzoate polyprenyltransferase
MDELKDIDTDRRLFPDRPVPRGDVQVQDLRLLGALIIAALFGLNFFVTGAVAPFLIVFGYASLMYRYFFLRRYLSQNILLSLVTHNPISYLIFLYVAGVYQNAVASEIDVGITPLLGVVFLSFFLSWEISRKIRQPGEETAYQTYSMLLGFRIALAIPVLLSATVVAILCVLYRGIISPTSRVAMLTALVIMTWAFVQVGRGKRPSLSLRMVMERFIMTVQSLLIVEGWLRS